MYHSAKVYLKQQSSQYPDGSIQVVDSQADLIEMHACNVLIHILFCCRYLHIGTSSWISFVVWRSRFGNLS